MAAEQIKLEWSGAGQGILTVDKVNFTVYEVTGAMDVPGYSQYRYEAKTPVDSGFTANFLSATNGTVSIFSYGGPPGQPLTTKANILWAEGPYVGIYRVTPDMSVCNFFVDREVNVV
jgi:hypothetical protein